MGLMRVWFAEAIETECLRIEKAGHEDNYYNDS